MATTYAERQAERDRLRAQYGSSFDAAAYNAGEWKPPSGGGAPPPQPRSAPSVGRSSPWGGGGGGAPPPTSSPAGNATLKTASGEWRSPDQLRQELRAAGANPADLTSIVSVLDIWNRTAAPKDRIGGGGSSTSPTPHGRAPLPTAPGEVVGAGSPGRSRGTTLPSAQATSFEPTTTTPPPTTSPTSTGGSQVPAEQNWLAGDGSDARGSDGAMFSQQSRETQESFRATYGDQAAQFWLSEHENSLEAGGQQTTETATDGTQLQTATPDAGARERPIMGPDGNVSMITATDEEWVRIEARLARFAEAQAQALEFEQGIQQGQLDVARANQAAQAAYQQALIEGNREELAHLKAVAAMENDFRQQQLELDRMVAAASIRAEQDQIDLQRRQMRPRRMASVRFQ